MEVLTLRRILIFILLTVSISVSGAAVAAQDDGSDGPVGGPEVLGDPGWYPDPPADDDETVKAAQADIVLAQPPYTMNYQGYLTNNGGSPLDGTYTIESSLYDAEVGGAQAWGPETYANVKVSNGLFHLVLGSSVELLPSVFNEALFLELKVGAITLPRQPLRATAYAYGLVPGAEIVGDPEGSDYAFSASNTGEGTDDSGIFASGDKYGIFARETGSGDVAIYSEDLIDSLGYRSRRDSFVFVPGHLAIPPDGYDSPRVDLDAAIGGVSWVQKKGSPGTDLIYLPIQVPTRQFGQNVTVEQVVLYYELSDPNNTYITDVILHRKDLSDGSTITMFNSTDDLKGSGVQSRSYTPSNAELSSAAGPMSLQIRINFEDTTDTVRLYGVRVRLGHY